MSLIEGGSSRGYWVLHVVFANRYLRDSETLLRMRNGKIDWQEKAFLTEVAALIESRYEIRCFFPLPSLFSLSDCFFPLAFGFSSLVLLLNLSP